MEPTSPARKVPYSHLIYLAFAFVAFFPCLALNKAYFANDLLYQFVPFRMFLKDQLAHGHFPLWNPYLFGGQPFFANPNSMMCYPLTYLTLLFPIPYDIGVFFFVHMFLAAAGMHFFLRTLRLSETACRVGALLFASSGLFWLELIHLQILAAYALFPWLLTFMEKTFKEGKPRWAFLSGLTFALIFCCGGFQSTTTTLYTALPYALFRVFGGGRTETDTPPYRWGFDKWMPILLFVLWGGLPLLSHLIPAQEFSGLSNRRDPSQTYSNFNAIFSMKPFTLYEFLFPTIGLPPMTTIESAVQQITDTKNVDNDFLGDFGYIGIWAPFLIYLAFKRKERSFLYFLGGLGILSILTAWGRYFPLHHLFCAILPGVDLSRAPFRFIQTYVLVGSVLSAYGFQTIERLLQEKGKGMGWLLAAGVYGLLLFLASLGRIDQTWRELLALLLGGAGLTMWTLSETWKALGRLFFQIALVLPLLLSGWNGYGLGPPSNFDYMSNFPAFSELKKRDTGRFFMDPNLPYHVEVDNQPAQVPLPENCVVALGIKDIGGYSPIYLKTQMDVKGLPLPTFSKLMAMRGLLMGPNKGDAIGFKKTDLGGLVLYEPIEPPPYLYAPWQVKLVDTESKELVVMLDKSFDPNEEALIHQPLPDAVKAKLSPLQAKLSYQLVSDQPDSQLFKVALNGNAFVTFSEIAYPGWKAFVDGQPSEVFTANHAFRALFLPVGEHQVEFRFKPSWVPPLLGLVAIWTLSAILYLAFLFISRRKPILAPASTTQTHTNG